MFYYIEFSIICIFVFLDSIHLYEVSNVIKYLNIISCMSMGAYYCYRYSKWKYILPLLLICFADYYLLFTTYYGIGVLFFFLIQNCYYYFLKQKIWFYSIYIVAILYLMRLHILDIVVIVYAMISVCNLYSSYKLYKGTRNSTYQYLFYTIGLLALCDLCVALQYFGLVIPYSSMCIWIFYLPSQLYFIKSIANGQKTRFIV